MTRSRRPGFSALPAAGGEIGSMHVRADPLEYLDGDGDPVDGPRDADEVDLDRTESAVVGIRSPVSTRLSDPARRTTTEEPS